jgi:hypothetical protein
MRRRRSPCHQDDQRHGPLSDNRRAVIPFAQFIRICRWLKLIHKERLAPLENTPFPRYRLENDTA